LLADRGFDADWIRALVSQYGAWPNIPPRRNRTEPICPRAPEGVFDGIQSNRRTVNMPDGIKEKGDRHHRGERGLGVAAARRVGRDGAKLVIGARQITS
jgi:hypothetical protein